MRQASLVTFYGPKSDGFRAYLRRCQDSVREAMRRLGVAVSFRPYSLEQIHATVVGLERRTASGLENKNFDTLRGSRRVMRLSGLFESLLRSRSFPFYAQFGGFEDRDYPFESRGVRPYDRSFSLQENIAVIVGWPIRAEYAVRHGPPCGNVKAYPRILEDLRLSAQKFNVLHRWHQTSTDVDNDLYLRLGWLDGELENSQLESVEDEIRRMLSAYPPLVVKLTVSDLSVVSYPADDDTLAVAESTVFLLTDPRLQSEDFIADLYN